MLFLHGGAYTMGNADAYRGFVSQIAARAQCSAFILDYPLAPEASIWSLSTWPVLRWTASSPSIHGMRLPAIRLAAVSPSQRPLICATGGASPLPCCLDPGRI